MKNKKLPGSLLAAELTPLTIKEAPPLAAQIAEWLETRGIYHDRLNHCEKIKIESGNRITLCRTGTPGRFAVVRGQIIFVEVKMFGEKPTLEQIYTHKKLRESGAIVIACDSFNDFTIQFSAIRAAVETTARKGNELYD